MAKLVAMPSAEVIDGLAGIIDFYEYHPNPLDERSIPVARRWPSFDPSNYPYGSKVMQPFFSYINRCAPCIPVNLQQAYQDMAASTGLAWKDHMVRCYLSKTNISGSYPPPGS